LFYHNSCLDFSLRNCYHKQGFGDRVISGADETRLQNSENETWKKWRYKRL